MTGQDRRAAYDNSGGGDEQKCTVRRFSKKKLPRSPNRADALVMLFWDFAFESLTAPPEDHSDLFSPTRQPRDREEYAAGPFDK